MMTVTALTTKSLRIKKRPQFSLESTKHEPNERFRPLFRPKIPKGTPTTYTAQDTSYMGSKTHRHTHSHTRTRLSGVRHKAKNRRLTEETN